MTNPEARILVWRSSCPVIDCAIGLDKSVGGDLQSHGPPCQSVNAFGGRRPVFVDVLRFLSTHPLPPSRDRFAVSRFRRVRIVRHRRIDFGLLRHRVQLFMGRIAAVHAQKLEGE